MTKRSESQHLKSQFWKKPKSQDINSQLRKISELKDKTWESQNAILQLNFARYKLAILRKRLEFWVKKSQLTLVTEFWSHNCEIESELWVYKVYILR